MGHPCCRPLLSLQAVSILAYCRKLNCSTAKLFCIVGFLTLALIVVSLVEEFAFLRKQRNSGYNEQQRCQFLDQEVRYETVYQRSDLSYLSDNGNTKFLRSVFNSTYDTVKHVTISPSAPRGTEKCEKVAGRRVLMNYADGGCCRQAQRRNCESGLRLGGFDMCLALSDFSVKMGGDEKFVTKNCHLLSQRLWLWKPYLIFQVLLALDYGDILFYADSGSLFIDNIDVNLVCLQKSLDLDIVVFSLDHPEYRYTKRDVFTIIGCDTPDCRYTPQRLASFVLLRKSHESLRFVSEWLAYAQDERLLENDLSWRDFVNFFFIDPRSWMPRFGEHRNDQSILSVLSKKWHLDAFPDPSQYGEVEGSVGSMLKQETRFKTLRNRILIDHSRLRD